MDRRTDPLQDRVDEEVDLYDVATWEPRSILDQLSITIFQFLHVSARIIIILLAGLILLAQLVLGGLGAIIDPIVGILVLISIVPAVGIVYYIWYLDITTREPLSLLLITLALAVLFAMFAGVVNMIMLPYFVVIPILGLPLFFLLIVGPIEETVKLLAIRLHAYRSVEFKTVVDGAVYGAAAGLGFATIENAMFITGALQQSLGTMGMIEAVGATVAARTLAGPGHVLYTSIAGFYLGLARFNPEHAGPIVVKGLLIAVLLHALYNTTVVALFTVPLPVPVPPVVGYLAFITIYFGAIGYFLYRKLARYRTIFEKSGTPSAD